MSVLPSRRTLMAAMAMMHFEASRGTLQAVSPSRVEALSEVAAGHRG